VRGAHAPRLGFAAAVSEVFRTPERNPNLPVGVAVQSATTDLPADVVAACAAHFPYEDRGEQTATVGLRFLNEGGLRG